MPGVPFEMEYILQNEVVPRLQQHFKMPTIVHSTALVFGIAESMLAQQIEAWEKALPPDLHLAYLPSPLGIKLRLSCYNADNQQLTDVEIRRRFRSLRMLVPENFVGIGDHTLEYFVADELRLDKRTVTVAESCTGGCLSTLLTSINGSSSFFNGGVVAYSNQVKSGYLGVNPLIIDRFGAVSKEVVSLMAQGMQRIMKSDYAIATSGIAGPSGGSKQKPVGMVWLAVATPNGKVTTELRQFGERPRNHIMIRASAAALNLLRMELRKNQKNKQEQDD
jgi:nicotinamide-nucleotide amidase